MCLDTIKKTGELPNGFGYKVFITRNEKIFPEYKGQQSKEIPTMKWIAEKEWRNPYCSEIKIVGGLCFHYFKYKHGFHIFKTLQDARRWNFNWNWRPIYKVRYRKAHAIGNQGGMIVVVAKEMKVLRKIKDK